MKDSTMYAAAQLPEKWRKAVRDVYGQGPAGAALLHCADELEAALTQQQGGEQEAGELLDIEVMRALFDSLPTSRAKDAYAAVKTYIDLCNENALRTKQPAASDCDRDRDTGRRRAAVEILLATGWQWQEGKWQPAASEGDVDWAKFPYSDAWCNGLSATLWECGMPNAQRQVEEIKDFVRAARANTSKQAAGEVVLAHEPMVPRKDMQRLYNAYVRLLESGRDRIMDLGGACDGVDVMERTDPQLIQARRSLATASPAQPSDAKDAERYRWLRDEAKHAPGGTPCPYRFDNNASMHIVHGAELDSAIDALTAAPAPIEQEG